MTTPTSTLDDLSDAHLAVLGSLTRLIELALTLDVDRAAPEAMARMALLAGRYVVVGRELLVAALVSSLPEQPPIGE